MSDSKLKRNYIRRKKYLNECVLQIKTILDIISLAKGESFNKNEKLAVAHAQAIEAACWSPHSKLTADNYQKLMNAKTRELCCAIAKKAMLTIDMTQLSKILLESSSLQKVVPCVPPSESPPIPKENNETTSDLMEFKINGDLPDVTLIHDADDADCFNESIETNFSRLIQEFEFHEIPF